MGATATKATISAELRSRAQQTRGEWKPVQSDLRDAAGKLGEAVAKADLRLIPVTRRVAEVAMRRMAHLVAYNDKTMTELRTVQDACEDDAPELREVARMMDELATISDAAMKLVQATRMLLAKAEQKLEALASSGDEIERKWAKGDAYIRDQVAMRRDGAREMAKVYAQAEKAVAARDAKALAAAQKLAQTAGRCPLGLSALRDVVKRITEGVDADKVSPELRKQIDKDRKTWADLLRAAEADELQIGLDRSSIDAMAVEVRDVAKAAKLLGIAGGDVARLAKVLELDDAGMLKGLEALARQLKLESTGKDMLAALRRARLV